MTLLDEPPEWWKPCDKKNIKPYERSGLVFEEKFAKYATLRWGGDYEVWCGRWIKYRTNNGKWYWAQPDVVLINHKKKTCTIFECKLSYRPIKAYRQLSGLYLPLLQQVYPDYKYNLVQVCRNSNKRMRAGLAIRDYKDLEKYKDDNLYAVWHWTPIPL